LAHDINKQKFLERIWQEFIDSDDQRQVVLSLIMELVVLT
jgi:hypothetical protein